jgi:hypothetical protein
MRDANGKKIPKCRPSQHLDRRRRNGRVKCEKCSDVFPCKKPCDHIDCCMEKGDPLPKWITLVETTDEVSAQE